MTGILIIFLPSVVSPVCEWHNGKEPFRLVTVGICALNLVVVTGHCSLLKRHVRDLHGTRGLDPEALSLGGWEVGYALLVDDRSRTVCCDLHGLQHCIIEV